MDSIVKQNRKLIDKGADLSSQVNTLLNQLQQTGNSSSKPVVVACGLMNAGKSYLLNMLTKHIDNEFFQTNDFRETAEIKTFEAEDFIYLDTPGLDANDNDSSVAVVGLEKADIVLFVHQLQGELEASEIEFLQTLTQSFGKFASDKIIIVLSKVDKESKDKVDEIQNRIYEQCEEYLAFTPTLFQVSNTRYKKGVEKSQNGLIEHSHINDLQLAINESLSNVSDVRKERLQQQKSQLIKKLNQQIETLRNAFYSSQKITQSFTKESKNFAERINELDEFIENQVNEYQYLN